MLNTQGTIDYNNKWDKNVNFSMMKLLFIINDSYVYVYM